MYITHVGKHQFSTGSEITNIIICWFEKMAGSRQRSATRLERVTEKEGLCFDRLVMTILILDTLQYQWYRGVDVTQYLKILCLIQIIG